MKEGWTYKRFDEVFDLQLGKTPSRDNSNYWGGDNVWVSIADLQGKYIDSSKESISDAAVSETGIKLVPKDTVIMSFKLSVGRSAITTIDLYTNEAIMAFTPRSGFDIIPDYIYYYLKGYKWQGANKAVKGMTLNKKSISENTFVYPDYEIQQEIVSELDLLSDVIEKRKTQIEELDKLAQSTFYDMFGDPVTNEKGWKKKKYEEFGSVLGGYAFKSNDFVDDGVPVLKIGNINTGVLKLSDVCFYPYNIKLKNYEVKPGDLTISLTGTTGKDDYGNVCLIPSIYPVYYLNQRNAILKIKDGCNNFYLQYVFKQKSFKIELTKNNHGIRQANILNKDILGLSIPLPPLALQQEFAAKVEAIEQMKAKVRQSLKESEELFNSRMDYYFN